MKQVKNKRDGNIGELDFDSQEGVFIVVCYDLDTKVTSKAYYKSIKDLTDDWEDYEVSKKWYKINAFDCFVQEIGDICGLTDKQIESIDALGLKFETREEAKKAVEKLKALTRLRNNWGLKPED